MLILISSRLDFIIFKVIISLYLSRVLHSTITYAFTMCITFWKHGKILIFSIYTNFFRIFVERNYWLWWCWLVLCVQFISFHSVLNKLSRLNTWRKSVIDSFKWSIYLITKKIKNKWRKKFSSKIYQKKSIYFSFNETASKDENWIDWYMEWIRCFAIVADEIA